jgi:hypothetical protein
MIPDGLVEYIALGPFRLEDTRRVKYRHILWRFQPQRQTVGGEAADLAHLRLLVRQKDKEGQQVLSRADLAVIPNPQDSTSSPHAHEFPTLAQILVLLLRLRKPSSAGTTPA